MEQLPDSSLIELAQGGDQHAFAELYSRYFDPVYDFVARMTRNRDEADDIAQDTFLKAMNALGGLQKGASFKSWIFTIARNTALNRIEKSSRTRPLSYEGEDGEEVSFDVVDSDRFSNPEEAAQASAVSALVWEAAAGLDPKQLSLLDLHLRQGLDSAEIADVLGVTKNNGYVMLNRLKKAVEDSIGAFIMLKSGRQYCEDLDFVLSRADIQGMSPEARKVVEKHVASCTNCEERKRKLAPLAAFAAFGAIGCPIGAKAHILEGLMQQWPGPAVSGGGGGAGGASGGAAAGGEGGFPTMIKVKRNAEGLRKPAVAVIAGLAAVLMALLFIPQSPLALIKDNSGIEQATPDSGPSLPPGGSGTQLPTSASGAPTPTNTPGPGGSPSPSTTTQQGQASPSATPTRTNTPVPTPGPGTPTFTPSPTATATSTPTSTATPTSTPPVSPTACVPQLSSTTSSLTIPPGGSSSFPVNNGSSCSTTFSVAPQASWLTVGGGGTLGPSGTATVSVTVNGSLPATPGTYTGDILVAWSGGSFNVTVTSIRTGPAVNTAPVINSVSGQCNPTAGGPPFSSWNASVSDNGSVASVVITFVDGGGTARTVTLIHGSGNSWSAGGPVAIRSTGHTIRATDNLGLQTSQTFSPTGCAG